jgi:hypothetical protein
MALAGMPEVVRLAPTRERIVHAMFQGSGD